MQALHYEFTTFKKNIRLDFFNTIRRCPLLWNSMTQYRAVLNSNTAG